MSITNEKRIWDYLINSGMTPCGAAGLMGNLYAESALNPINLQNTFNKKFDMTDTEYTTAVDNNSYTNFENDGAGYGLAQWTYHTRKKGLLDHAKSLGVSIGDLDMQLEYLVMELKKSYASVYKKLTTTQDLSEASDMILTKYECPANQSDAVKALRLSYAQKYYDKFAPKEAVPMTECTKGTAVQVSKNFESIEFDCNGKGCCNKTKIDPKLVEILQKIREYFNVPVTINSAYRCEKHNKKIGGAPNSKHLYGQAADIKVKGVKPLKVAQYAESIGVKGIGRYTNFVHVDTRTTKFFWIGSGQKQVSTFGGQSAFKDNINNKPDSLNGLQNTLGAVPDVAGGTAIKITGNAVNIRTGPGAQYAKKGNVAKKGEVYSVLNTEQWTAIQYGDNICWISKAYVSIDNKCTGKTVNIRCGPGKEYGVVATAKKGDTLSPIQVGAWVPIIEDGFIGWVSKTYVAYL